MTMATYRSERTAKLMGDFSSVFLRLALGGSFLSAVGDHRHGILRKEVIGIEYTSTIERALMPLF
jgi:hypothetical protein